MIPKRAVMMMREGKPAIILAHRKQMEFYAQLDEKKTNFCNKVKEKLFACLIWLIGKNDDETQSFHRHL